MLEGEYTSPLGDKNRVAIPKKMRVLLKGDIVITRGYEHCLIIVDQTRWEDLIREINERPLLSMSVRDTKRFIIGGAYRLTLDKQGRFVIPESLIEYAEIEVGTTFVGVGEWLEIWDSEKWRDKLNDLSIHAADIADRLN
jgi:MraZ protein